MGHKPWSINYLKDGLNKAFKAWGQLLVSLIKLCLSIPETPWAGACDAALGEIQLVSQQALMLPRTCLWSGHRALRTLTFSKLLSEVSPWFSVSSGLKLNSIYRPSGPKHHLNIMWFIIISIFLLCQEYPNINVKTNLIKCVHKHLCLKHLQVILHLQTGNKGLYKFNG